MFFKFLIFLLVLVLIMRWLGFSMRVISSYKKRQRRSYSQDSKQREGEIRITHNPQKDKKITTEEGEYVDFEDTTD